MKSQRLEYVLRVRDLVHGFVYLTEVEKDVINHALFQRLRHIRQNDVAFFVYPSLNISRFEHSLGCLHVVSKMAKNLLRSSVWNEYQNETGLDRKKFLEVCRLYALLHDVGHFPLSHLFEKAFQKYAITYYGVDKDAIEDFKDYFGVGKPFEKIHEAAGAKFGEQILENSKADKEVSKTVLKLLKQKYLSKTDPLCVVKLLIDSEIDADRIDSIARDGLLAGREYGNYDIERICSSVFIQKEPFWRIAYSDKAMGSMEGLLLDRYRTHTWIHFHHRVVAIKAATIFVLSELFHAGVIQRTDFPFYNPSELALRDDVWLWAKIRANANLEVESRDRITANASKACYDALLYRKYDAVTLLWKNRAEFRRIINKLLVKLVSSAILGNGKLREDWFDFHYENHLSKSLQITAVVSFLGFTPIGGDLIPLTDEVETPERNHLIYESPLVRSLDAMWTGEPNFYIIFLGAMGSREKGELEKNWLNATVDWINEKERNGIS